VSRIDLAAARKLFGAARPAGTERDFHELFYLRGLPVWCEDHLIDNVHAVSVGVGVISVFEAWRRFPHYKWQTDREQLERLLVPNKQDVKDAIKAEAERRHRTGEPMNAGILYRWASNRFPASVVPTGPRIIQIWLYNEWGFEHPPPSSSRRHY
jgi:hypothetical protein